MRSQLFAFAAITALGFGFVSCVKKGTGKGVPDNGQLMGASYGNVQGMSKPIGMVYVPPGTFTWDLAMRILISISLLAISRYL